MPPFMTPPRQGVLRLDQNGAWWRLLLELWPCWIPSVCWKYSYSSVYKLPESLSGYNIMYRGPVASPLIVGNQNDLCYIQAIDPTLQSLFLSLYSHQYLRCPRSQKRDWEESSGDEPLLSCWWMVFGVAVLALH